MLQAFLNPFKKVENMAKIEQQVKANPPILLYNSVVWGAYTLDDFVKQDKTWTEKTYIHLQTLLWCK